MTEDLKRERGRPIGLVKKYLIDHPRQQFTHQELATITGLEAENVLAQLNYMSRYHRGARRDPATGNWVFYERSNVFNAPEPTVLKRKAEAPVADCWGAQANLRAMQDHCRLLLSTSEGFIDESLQDSETLLPSRS